MKLSQCIKYCGIAWMVLLLVGSALPAHAELSPGQKVIQRAAKHAASFKTFSLEATLEVGIDVDGEEDQYVSEYRISYQRPDLIAVSSDDEQMSLFLYSDKKSTTRYIKNLDQYLVEDTPTEHLKLIQSLSNPLFHPVLNVLAEYISTTPFTSLLADGVEVKLVGEEKINNVLCDRVTFTFSGLNMSAWFSKGDTPLLHRVMADMPELVKRVKENSGGEKVSVSVQINSDKWSVDGDIKTLLTFTPSENSEKVEQFGKRAAATELKGKVAPAIKLSMLDGSEFDLASKKGKEVVILDFWATWCGPCRQGMPILSKVAKEFEDKGVRLYAVNLREDNDAIQSFLDSTGLKLNVVKDEAGIAADAYHVESIPQMVIIGRDGIVKQVHIGLTPSYEKEVRAELKALTK